MKPRAVQKASAGRFFITQIKEIEKALSGLSLRSPCDHDSEQPIDEDEARGSDIVYFGGEEGIRTLAAVIQHYSLSRGAPYSHLGTSPNTRKNP